MLTPDRHQLILKLLKQQSTVKIQDIVEATNSSESTIRRDLTQLEKGKYLKRVHGGASRLQGKLQEPSMIEKSAKNLQEKKQIAKHAASLVEEGDSIYLDAGSTVAEIIPFLPVHNIVVVTNGLTHVNQLIDRNITTYIIGGFAKPKTNAVIGRGALESLKQYRFDKCFMGVNGIHPEFGFTTPDQEEALIKQTAIGLAREAYVLADDSKLFEIGFAKIGDLHEAVIITNEHDEESLIEIKSKTMVKVVNS
ncbi:DeoR/GlpR family DNA-binding transcription regulator [Bacillus mesophilum]|uniref:DeoR/GlpR transcriptional regulator n=1 Tax=Bacillus mesophilum TaxID=1071718 RepID=A0A7V7RMH1_9BACI|nr:DeoR/GlpR family DNA-binding transcription regulator [Bacillus mesophilum]KAB2333494.1 DeoR/GlpR transcriptional regulator [Bacillus mesophilum]